MTLIATIKLEQLNARKARDSVKASLLTTLLGELQTLAKNSGKDESTDAQVVVLVKSSSRMPEMSWTPRRTWTTFRLSPE